MMGATGVPWVNPGWIRISPVVGGWCMGPGTAYLHD